LSTIRPGGLRGEDRVELGRSDVGQRRADLLDL
jgi:hypothetical protein